MVNGGFYVDGGALTKVDEEEIRIVAGKIIKSKIRNIVISGIKNYVHEEYAIQYYIYIYIYILYGYS